MPYADVKNTLLFEKIGVATFARPFAAFGYRNISLPSDARTPTPADAVNVMYVRTPCTSAAMTDEYPAGSLRSFDVQTVFPVILSSFTMPAPGPPGETMTCGPSTSGDSLISHCSCRPPKSRRIFRCHTAVPSVLRHARSPLSVST